MSLVSGIGTVSTSIALALRLKTPSNKNNLSIKATIQSKAIGVNETKVPLSRFEHQGTGVIVSGPLCANIAETLLVP
jgi:hypothetical protein